MSSEVRLPAGRVLARVVFTSAGAFTGDVELFFGDVPVGAGRVERTHRVTLGVQGFTVGHQRGPAVTTAYAAPFAITPGVLRLVTMTTEGREHRDPVGEQRAAIAMQ